MSDYKREREREAHGADAPKQFTCFIVEPINQHDSDDVLEHRAGRVGMDLRYKGYSRTNEILIAGASQINGKSGNSLYIPKDTHSRPYYGYDAGFDPTILNAVRNKMLMYQVF